MLWLVAVLALAGFSTASPEQGTTPPPPGLLYGGPAHDTRLPPHINEKQYGHMHSLAEMATQGLLPGSPPALITGGVPAQYTAQMNPAGHTPPPINASSSAPPALLPPPLLPNKKSNQGPSPQFLEMMKRLEKEHGGQLPPGLGAFTAPPPLPGFENVPVSLGPMFSGAGAQNETNNTQPFNPEAVLPAVALPRELPAQPKGPSIPQIMEMQRKHQQYMDKQRQKEAAEKQVPKTDDGHHHHHHRKRKGAPAAAAPSPVDAEFRSELVHPTVDQWIDQEIAKKSASFRERLGHVYNEKKETKSHGHHAGEAKGIHDDYDPDGTVFLSKISNVLSTEHPDLGSRLDRWIDNQVDSAIHHHKKRHNEMFGDDQDGGDVWLQNVLHHSDSEESGEMNEALSRDFAKGMFFSSAKTNKAEFGQSRGVTWEETGKKSDAGHRKFKRRVKRRAAAAADAADDGKAGPSQVVLLELSSESFREELRREFASPEDELHKMSDEALFGQSLAQSLNFDPNDNRYRTDKDTNVQDPDYTDYKMQRVVEKHRRAGGVKSKQSAISLDKWTKIATGRDKDPLEDMFPGSKFDFTENLASQGNFDLDHILGALNTPTHHAKRRVKRKSEAWGE